MKLFVENQLGPPFEIEVMLWDRVFDIKEKIFETQHIPVHKQTLFIQGQVLDDALYVDPRQHESRFQLFITPDHIPNHSNDQGLQTQQSPLPLLDKLNNNQDSLVKVPLQSNDEFLNFQDTSLTLGRSDNSQVLQTTKNPVLSNSIRRNHQSRPVTSEDILDRAAELVREGNNNRVFETQGYYPLPSIDELFNNQDFSLIMNSVPQLTGGRNNNPVPQTKKSPLSNPKEHIIKKKHLPVKVGRIKKTSRGTQTDQSPRSDSIKEITPNIPDSPGKLRVLVLPYRDHLKIPVEVNTNDNVEELRKELVEMQKRSQLDLPQEGYFFKHKQRTVNDLKSFQWNGVSQDDTIEIVPGMPDDLGNSVSN